MSISIKFPKADKKYAGTVIIGVFENNELGTHAKDLDKTTNGFLSHALKNSKNFKGKHGQIVQTLTPPGNALDRVILLGLGKNEELDALKVENAAGTLFAGLGKSVIKDVSFLADRSKKLKIEVLAAHFANGFALRAYNFDRYKSKPQNPKTPKPQNP